ncbi:MAG: hypothetical protein HYV36_05320 [Lentisphaerae bacterium]|nr:hypothetical protein [Lentisphaerota bacterium]
MKLKDVMQGLKTDYSPQLFTPEVISAVESDLKERNGKFYVLCRIRGKEVQARPGSWACRRPYDMPACRSGFA